jgi:hypothetical protein
MDKASTRGTESEVVDLEYPNDETLQQHVVVVYARVLLALRVLRHYRGLDPSLWVPQRALMPRNTAAVEGFVYYDALASVNAVKGGWIKYPAMEKANRHAFYLQHDLEDCQQFHLPHYPSQNLLLQMQRQLLSLRCQEGPS